MQNTATIHSAVPRYDGRFGISLALSENRLIVGAEREDSENDSHAGAAYLYSISEDGNPTLLERFTHPQGRYDDYFGSYPWELPGKMPLSEQEILIYPGTNGMRGVRFSFGPANRISC